MKRLSIFLCLALFSLAFGIQAANADGLDAFKSKEGTISIAGGTAHIPVMKDAAKAIMSANPAIRITIAGGGSGVGIQKVGEGLVNIGNSGRKASEAEVSKYGLVMFPFAVDGVATVIHADNPVQALTGDQVRAIFAGEITNWKEVGGNDGAINVYARDESSGTRAVYWKKLLNKGTVVASANVVPSNGAMKLAVSKDPNAIGYVSIGHLDGSVKAPDLDGVQVNQEAAKSGQYPVVRKLYMNTKGEPEGIVKSFVEYITGPDCVEFIKAAGYIPF
ncbi:phosphate ABC transporter substrate-binding protein [Pseudodesulfovibrio thermohalotolerans]|uniref:phosphate ABC transporter substrate-binding protein n=1 Tax=Pseudodesulfovibrio thermohalotolerans TaxID=2880651 RepID=UPI002442143B|nr:phosphate ABC transporter substrate-binding protein [Pseudodesulfovibrio thermohalotolerans]WFS62515.1 phosphate ABC transporter substrate-binding protein [Pseudodesulfovibrio thermohalotolerans]